MTGNAEKRLHYLKSAFETAQDINNVSLIAVNTLNLSLFYLNHNQIDSALKYLKISMNHIQISGYRTYEGDALKRLGEIFVQKKDYKSAKYYFHESISANLAQHNEVSNAATLYDLANLYSIVGNPDSAFYYLHQLLQLTRNINENTLLIKAYADLYTLHKNTGNRDSAYFYLQIYSTLNDSMNRAEKESLNAYQNVAFNQQIEKDAEEKRRLKKENSTRTYFLLAGILVCLIITFLIFRNNVIRKNANQILEFQKSEIEKQKKNIEETLNNLKSTQSQLVQAEKMASLGELTAGIAHEIQNPLNFVNNFAEVNVELIEELETEANKGNLEEVKLLAKDIKENETKINHHGKRADAIVKNMLQHSRKTSGQKELTDINALCDEYLRLSYHGLRAKDKSFNAEFETKFDATLAPINVVPQDIGRVILNLINNAFYAVNARQKMEQQGDYKPQVTISTRKEGNQLVIAVSDNGTGMTEQVKEKIFQPFFTTKPTGEGTGLGLSLSYDIVTKGHGGELRVETKEGVGTEFIIQLPIV
jgi:signal transduction histidine kinase